MTTWSTTPVRIGDGAGDAASAGDLSLVRRPLPAAGSRSVVREVPVILATASGGAQAPGTGGPSGAGRPAAHRAGGGS
ncbi:hypothetical protein [Cellulomonas aerilata]|uniref:Uncharacterized protein n=1 Tax=Cellulomonas aerilata TaxID=515326 RepID=A0A512DFX1_9CELL|nr:hypothetical protein [Cellulomonas aerilata]GEO35388.1 hypothetical protein CAE01nite_31130 [Cellulomonas aerilata]